MTARGPERWKRAALNAVRRPNSPGARLYFDRVTVAHKVRSETEQAHLPWEMLRYDARLHGMARVYTMCSVFCMVLQCQLDGPDGEEAVEALISGTSWSRVQPLDTATLSRDVRCQVCGGTIMSTRA